MKISYLISILAIFIFSGCGGGDSVSSNASNETPNNIKQKIETINMQKNRAYIVKKGDKIEKVSSNPVIKMQSELGSDKTVVTLISGEAKIIKK